MAVLAAAGFLLALLPPHARSAAAHDVDVTSVARVFLEETGEGRYALSIVDAQVQPILDVEGVIPERCTELPADIAGFGPGRAFTFHCEGGLTFEDVLSLPWSLAGVVVIARWSDGTDVSAYFRGDGATVPVRLGDLRAGGGSRTRLAITYLVLGAEHILFGIDHLLFVLGLLLLVRGAVPLVKTITAFTIAHSITLGAAVLEWVPVAVGPVEAAIALSIVLLAREIVMARRGREHLVHRKPWLVAFAFGLLHGFGFAGALGEIGLRGADVPWALLFFNVGVEVGQLLFVAGILLAYRFVRKPARAWLPRLEPALGYALGGLATLWFVQRLPALWGG